MAFCGNCGTNVNDGVNFCPSCGTAMSAAQAQSSQYQSGQDSSPQQTDTSDAEQNKVMAMLGYILFFVPLITGDYKKSPFVHFHTNQGTALFLSCVAFGVVYVILTTILAFIPILGWALIVLIGLCWLVFPILCIVGVINAVNGKMTPLPVIGKFTIIK